MARWIAAAAFLAAQQDLASGIGSGAGGACADSGGDPLSLLQVVAKAQPNLPASLPVVEPNKSIGAPAFPDGVAHEMGKELSVLKFKATDCSNPPGVTCQCADPSYPCRLAYAGSCYCFSHSTQNRCESAGGHWCVRPSSCVDHCALCQDENSCSECKPGYMQVYGFCTKMPETESGLWQKAHNILRCAHGSEPLAWSQAAADSAKAWADHLVGINRLQHAGSYNEPPPAGPAGENLAWNYGSPQAASTAWYSEVECCSSLPGCESGSCAIGHFTAMVWAGVTELGCATSGAYQVCRYRSGDALSCDTANMRGCYGQNVLAQSKDISTCIDEFDGPATTTAAATTTTTTAAPLPTCTIVPKGARGECETCIKSRDCMPGYKCHNKNKRCIPKSGGLATPCQTLSAGCGSDCKWNVCTNSACDACDCTRVGDGKTYEWLVWQNLANSNSKSPEVTCVEP